jgi:hypothetical protein
MTPHTLNPNPNPSIFVFPADYLDSNFPWGELWNFCFFFGKTKQKNGKQNLELQFLSCLGKRSTFC